MIKYLYAEEPKELYKFDYVVNKVYFLNSYNSGWIEEEFSMCDTAREEYKFYLTNMKDIQKIHKTEAEALGMMLTLGS